MTMLLNELIESLSNSVSEAQDRIENHQIERFKSYFDADRRPRKLDIRLPSLHPNAIVGQEEEYRVPLLPLVASSLLKIKEVEIEFDINLVDISDDTTGIQNNTGKKNIGVDLNGNIKNSSAHVVLKLEGRELSEGMARVIERLVTSQGTIRTDEV
jgi:hypothetical protein